MADACDARIACSCRIAANLVGVGYHAAELQHHEPLAVAAHTDLTIEGPTGTGHRNHHTDDQYKKKQK